MRVCTDASYWLRGGTCGRILVKLVGRVLDESPELVDRVKQLPLEYSVELNKLIEFEMEGSVG